VIEPLRRVLAAMAVLRRGERACEACAGRAAKPPREATLEVSAAQIRDVVDRAADVLGFPAGYIQAEGTLELKAMENMTHFELRYRELCWSLLEDGAWPA
jgi:hypothetical protein